MPDSIVGMQPDFMYPCGDGKNRNEYLLFEYDDVIQSVVEMIFYGLIFLPDIHNFPKLDEIGIIDPKEFFFKYSIFEPMQFLDMFASEECKSKPDYEDYLWDLIQRCQKIDTTHYRTRTMLIHAMRDLAHTHYVKEIMICSYRQLEEFEVNHLLGAMGSAQNKFKFYVSTVSDLLKNNPNITSVFMRDIDELLEILARPEEHHLKNGTLLSLRNSLSNIEINVSGDTANIKEKYADEILELTKRKPYAVARFYSLPLTDPKDNTTNLSDQLQFEAQYKRYNGNLG